MLSASPSMEKQSSEERSDPFAIPWHKQAACFSEGYALFFHDGRLGVQEVARAAKRQFCTQCPVRDLCLEQSLEYRDKFGIWGGLTPKERKRLLNRIDAGELTIAEAVEQVCNDSAAA